MTLKHRVKTIEGKINQPKKGKLWVIKDAYWGDKRDIQSRKRIDKKTLQIKEGKIKHDDGTYYREGDVLMIINQIFTDKKPCETRPYKPFGISENDNHEEEIPPQDDAIEQRIKALEQRKSELEKKIRESEK